MKIPDRAIAAAAIALILAGASPLSRAQSSPANRIDGSLMQDLRDFVATPAVSGYERDLSKQIAARLKPLAPQIDNLGDVIVTFGSGSPHRLIVAPLDEPGFVVSDITTDGYLRVQSLPQNGRPPLFTDLYAAQPVRIQTVQGAWIDGVVAGLSVHLQSQRTSPPKSNDIENMYVDIGANSPDEVRRAGVDLLSPLAIDRAIANVNGNPAAASVGDRFGAAALIEMLRHLDAPQLKGTLTVAFVVQQWTGARGLQRILTTQKADEMIYVGRLLPGGAIEEMKTVHRAPRRELGSGVLIGLPQVGESLVNFPAEIKQTAELNHVPIVVDYSASVLPRSYLPLPDLPGRSVHLGIASDWASTPAEMIDSADLAHLVELLEAYATGKVEKVDTTPVGNMNSSVPAPNASHTQHALIELTQTYGVSDHEAFVREEVKRELPDWAKPETDDTGNLIVHWGTPNSSSKSPGILVVAHMDEIGFEVKSIATDGHLDVEWKGSGDLSFYQGHPALVHTSSPKPLAAVVNLPAAWDQSAFQWPEESSKAIHVDIGAHSAKEAADLGIKPGDWITIPKKYRQLAGTRANGRSFDDRVGCAALIGALWALGPSPSKDRDVTFVFSTGEELGLNGAGAAAKALAAAGRPPATVFAIDTFVSSDSPLESKRYADAEIGKGFVIRAIDGSNIAPRDQVERVIQLARENKIPVQYGVTGGGNDGSAFTRYGSVDIALGWPLRYSHSPAEVIDTRDVDSLSRIVAALAKSW
jgi:putative aminopeptidase FrvX